MKYPGCLRNPFGSASPIAETAGCIDRPWQHVVGKHDEQCLERARSAGQV